MKKMLVLLLTLCLLAGMVPLGAGAEEGTSCEGGTACPHAAAIGDKHYDTLVDAVKAVQDSTATTIKLLKNVDNGDGIIIPEDKNITIDFATYTYTVTQNLAGSSGSENQCFQLLENSTVVLKNGAIVGNNNSIKMMVQNYSNLTLESMSLDATKGTNSISYVSSNNCGKVFVTGNTTITAKGTGKAFDVSYWPSAYPDGTQVEINTTGTITGDIEIGLYGANGSITLPSQSVLSVKNVNLVGNITTLNTTSGQYDTGLSDEDAKKAFADKMTISGGTFSSNVSQYTEEGYTAVQKDGKYVVEKLDATNAVASVGENYFKSVADAVEEAAKNNGTVILLRDAMFDTLSLSTGSVTVDLSGYRLTSDSGKTSDVTNSSKLIIQDSRGTGKLVYNGFQDPAQAAFEIQAGSSITLNGTHYETSGTGVFAWGNATIVNVQDTVIDSKGYCVGTNAAQTANYQVDINIVNSQLTSALDGAGTAVLFNVPGTLDIENSTLNGHWQGIIARGGTITVRDSVITNTYNKLNNSYEDKWGTGNAVTVAGIAIGNKGEENDGYNFPVSVTLENTSVTSVGPNPAIYVYQMEGKNRTVTVKISGDSAVSGDFIVEKDANVEKVGVSISGGYFTSDPSDYVATGYYAGESDNAAYAYQVKEGKADTEPAEVVAAEPKVNAAAGIDGTVTTALSGTTADLTAAANEQAAQNTVDAATAKKALEDASINVGTTDTVTVVVQPYLEMKATGYSDDAAVKTMTVDIKAMYRTVATTADLDNNEPIYVQGDDGVGKPGMEANAVVIGEKKNTLPVKGSVEISIPLPTGFITETGGTLPTIYVQHKNTYEYEAEVTSTGETTPTYTATFTNPHGFSTFVLSTEPKAVATVNGTNYTNFQQAVNAAGPNGIVTVQKGGQTATDVTYNLTLKNDGTDSITVTINGEKITIPAGETKPFTYTAPTPPRPTEEKHSITISTDGKGQVTGPASAAEDDKVTLTVKPNADKELYDLKITDEDGKAIAVTKVNDTTYTFTMPDGKVTIAATFGCDGGDNCPSKAFIDLGDKQWYHDFIDYAVENGLLEGTSPTTMEPNATLIRAQLAQILYNIEDKPAVTGEMVFEDVPASEWFYSPILWANQNEIINGTSPTTFEPLEDISRQDLALMLYRYAGKPAVTGDLDGFTDADQVGDWAEEAMAWAVAEGIVQGDTPTTLNPTGTATRAEAAAMLQRFLEDAA